MALKIQGVKGAADILPQEIATWHFVEEKTRELFERFGFKEIRTPVFEHTELFVRSVGEGTDIVTKEMYTFVDKAEKSLTMRPEETASVVRAYLQHSYHVKEPFQKWYYIGPMFRRERPQAGRQRQFHQIGVEVLGGSDPQLDAELLSLTVQFFEAISLNDIEIKLNNVGCNQCRPKYIGALKEYLKSRLAKLCEDCHVRFEKNILRILDCKNKDCRPVIDKAPVILDSICPDLCGRHYEVVKNRLKLLGITFTEDPHMVRGLDYYTRTVFEIVHPALGAQDAIGAGGRYDNLIGDLGGPKELGATGFAFGMERILMALTKKNVTLKEKSLNPDIFLVSLGEDASKQNFKLLYDLRCRGITAEMDMTGRSVKAQMRSANKSNARFTLIRGEDEIKSGKVTLKNMKEGTEESLDPDKVINILKY